MSEAQSIGEIIPGIMERIKAGKRDEDGTRQEQAFRRGYEQGVFAAMEAFGKSDAVSIKAMNKWSGKIGDWRRSLGQPDDTDTPPRAIR